MRFYLDEDLSDRIATIARGQGIDVISSHECGRDGLADDEQLLRAPEDSRCLVTRNRADFVAWTVRFYDQGWPHVGVLLVPESLPGDRFAAIADSIASYDACHPDGMSSYTVDFLQPARGPAVG